MNTTFPKILTLFAVLVLSACGNDDGLKSGNAEACRDGETCENDCSANDSTCELECMSGSECTATCRAGLECQFNCQPGASCDFNCNAGSCQVQGTDADCMCSGNCLGTCGGGANPGAGGAGGAGAGAGGAGGGGAGCEAGCGSPLDPGYAECIGACS